MNPALPILSTLRPEGMGCSFAHDSARAVAIGIDASPIACPRESALDAFAAQGVFLAAILPNRQGITVKEARFPRL